MASNPSDVTTGPDGNVWFIGGGGAGVPAIGYITPARHVSELTSGFSYPNSEPEAIAPGPDGNMWFLDIDPYYEVGHVDLHTTPYTLGETTYAVDQVSLDQITAGPDGNECYTADGELDQIKLNDYNAIIPVTAGGHGLGMGADPDAIAAGPDGNVWFTDQNGADYQVGKIVPATLQATEYPLPTQQTPWTMAFGSDGDLYVVQTGLVAQVTPAGQITELPAPTSTIGADTDSIVPGPDGNLYYNDIATKSLLQVGLGEKPVATTGAASSVTTSGATISGSVTPLNAVATVSVLYGTTAALGSSAAAATLAAGTTASPVSAALQNLPAATTVCYEVAATNANGTATGQLRSFTTQSLPPTTTTTTTPPAPKPMPAPAVISAVLGSRKLTLTTISAQLCVAASAKLGAALTVTQTPGSHATQRLQNVTFTIDRGLRRVRRETVRRGGRRRKVTVTVYVANATFRKVPATARLALTGLKPGNHTLTVVATYSAKVGSGRHRHVRLERRTLRVHFHIC